MKCEKVVFIHFSYDVILSVQRHKLSKPSAAGVAWCFSWGVDFTQLGHLTESNTYMEYLQALELPFCLLCPTQGD